MHSTFRLPAVLLTVALLVLAIVATQRTSAQVSGGELFGVGVAAAYCEPGYLGPFVGCTPWEGLTVSITSDDGSIDTSCVTAAADMPEPRAAACAVEVPYGATVTASIDPAAIPDGYVLQGDLSVVFEVPSGPPDGETGGPVFVLLPAVDGGSGGDDSGNGSDDGGVTALPSTGSGAAAMAGSAFPAAFTLLFAAVLASASALAWSRPRR